MTTTFRLFAAFAVALLASSAAHAQPPTAPLPHLALDELVKEYRRLGLPIPPPNAELARIEWYSGRANPFLVGLRIPAAKPGELERYLIGSGLGDVPSWKPAMRVDPTPEALREVAPQSTNFLWLAIQSKMLGWDEFADYLHGRSRSDLTPLKLTFAIVPKPGGGGSLALEIPRSLKNELRGQAWRFWENQISEEGADREQVYRRLKGLAEADEAFRTPYHRDLLQELEQTVALRTAKPGSVESLIDDLTEYQFDVDWVDDRATRAFWKLAEHGFDALPALIEHAQDLRFTRKMTGLFNNFHPYRVRVGHLTSGLLDALSDGELGVWGLRGDMADPGEALKWYATARRIGEEKWLVGHALPEREAAAFYTPAPNAVILRAIRVKYPARLPELYQMLLRKRPWLESQVISKEIVTSKLPREQKIALLAEGAAHAKLEHRVVALAALAGVDSAALRMNLIQTLVGVTQ